MAGDDDFFSPRNTDTYEPCADDSNIAQGSVVLPIGAALSVLCYLYLMWMYFVLQSPIFKRHPTTLAVYKCMIELIFIQQYLWMPSIGNQKFFDDDHDMPPYKCSSSEYAAYLAFITQFSLVGSEICFFIISYDLRLAYTNPFSSFKENRNFFLGLVLGISLLTSFILILLGPRVYGMSDLGLIWIQKRREPHSPNYPKAVLYYIITIAVFVYSIWANFQFSKGSEKGFSKTLSNRLSIMKRSKRFTAGYVGYGCIVFLMEFISYASKTDAPIVNYAPAYLLAFRGVWGLWVILYSNYSELTWELLNPFHIHLQEERMKEDIAMEKLLLQPHLNTALRAEILYFTTQGIMFAANDYHRRQLTRKHSQSFNHTNNTSSNSNHNHLSPLELTSNNNMKLSTGMKTENEEDEEDSLEYSLNESSSANVRAWEKERSHSTAGEPTASIGVSSSNNRRSLQIGRSGMLRTTAATTTTNNNSGSSSPATPAGLSHQASLNAMEEYDMSGMDMFSRNSIAIFERLNLEQSAAVNKEMEAAFKEEAAALGLKTDRRNAKSAAFPSPPINRENMDYRNSLASAPRTYNPFHTQALPASSRPINPLQRKPSEIGVEMELKSTGAAVGGVGRRFQPEKQQHTTTTDEEMGGGEVKYNQEEEEGEYYYGGPRETDIYDPTRESYAVDVEFGMNNNNTTTKDHTQQPQHSGSTKNILQNVPLWKRIETPPPLLSTTTDTSTNTTVRTNSQTSERLHSTDTTLGLHDRNSSSRSSGLSKAFFDAIHTASDVAKSFFQSSQYKEFRFKDFCPKLFGKIRELSGINSEEYAKNFEKTCKEKFSEGRSGAFMFFSSNEKYIVKTTTKSESLALHSIMPKYVEFLKNNPNSLVCRFLGAHCITMYGNELYFVVMLNVFPTFPLSERYDLKGSWVNRHGFEFSRKTKHERMRREPKSESSPLYQDNDLQHKISLEEDVTYALASQIRRDILFLREMQLMDYSLLIGVRRERFKVLDNANSSNDTGDRMSRASIMRDTELSVTPSFDARGSLRNVRAGHASTNSTSSIVARPSMLTTVPVEDAFKRDHDGGMRARLVEGPGTYYIGIIDVLQEWNFKKKMERFLKIYFKQYDADGISAIEPSVYCERFWRGAVLDTFDGLEYDNEDILTWKGDESLGEEKSETAAEP